MSLREYSSHIRRCTHKHWKIITGIIITILFVLVGILPQLFYSDKIFDASKLTSYSKIKTSDNRSYFNVNSENGYLYKSNKIHEDAVRDFLRQKFTDQGKYIVPDDIVNNSTVIRSEKSSSLTSNEHYFLEQTLNGIPIYGSSIVVHLRNKNEIYSTSGNIILTKDTTLPVLSKESAKEIALNDSLISVPLQTFVIRDENTIYYNKGLLEDGEDFTNRIAISFFVDSNTKPIYYSTFYIVDLENGEILYKEDQLKESLNRTVYNCSGSSCSTAARTEGSSSSGIAEADSAYNILGDVYNFFLQSFNRDSFDGNGAPYIAYVNFPGISSMQCPNAAWTGAEMIFCAGLVTPDISWHELTHAMTSRTAGLKYEKQSGALNESISDIFATSSDNNWTIGEGSAIGIKRSVSDPPSIPKSPRQPDRLFSNYYYCGGLTTVCDKNANDMCGVHINSGIMNKTFYLMTEGGNFNGCNISGIGRKRSNDIIYSALTNYLTSTSNFYDMYSSILQSCADLYGSGSDICKEVQKAAQATELDQQTTGSQAGPSCSGAVAKPATCSGAPTSEPLPTLAGLPTSTPTPPLGATSTPTLPPGTTATPTPTPVSGSATSTPTPSGGIFKPKGTPTPTPDQYFSCAPDPKCISNGKSIQLCPLICTPK